MKKPTKTSIIGWTLAIVMVGLVAYKELNKGDMSDPLFLFDTMTTQIASQTKVPKENVTLQSKFGRDLNMKGYDQDTLAFRMAEVLDIKIDVEGFREKSTVGEAVDFVKQAVLKHRKEKRSTKVDSEYTNSNAEAAKEFVNQSLQKE